MKALLPSAWTELQRTVSAMPESSDPREILSTLLTWLAKNSETVCDEPFLSYGLDRFLGLDIDSYPFDMSSMRGAEFEHFKKVIKRYSSEDAENIARYLRDTLESLIVLEVDRQCPRCESWGMGAYKDCRDERIIFECRQCGFASYSDGVRASHAETTFSSIEDLRKVGLI